MERYPDHNHAAAEGGGVVTDPKTLTYEVGVSVDELIERLANDEPARPPKQVFPPRAHGKLQMPDWHEGQ